MTLVTRAVSASSLRLANYLVGYWMLFVGLLPLGGIGQLNGIPNLLEHYNQHQAEADMDGLWHFLLEHYTDATHHGSEHDHTALPFFQAVSTAVACIASFCIGVNQQTNLLHAWVELQLPSYNVLLPAPLQPPRS